MKANEQYNPEVLLVFQFEITLYIIVYDCTRPDTFSLAKLRRSDQTK